MISAVNTLLTLISAALLPLSLPNELVRWGIAPLGLVAIAPVLAMVYRAPDWRHAARRGALFGAVSTAIGNYWLAFFGEFSVWTIGGTVIGYTGYNYILFGYLFHAIHGLSGSVVTPAPNRRRPTLAPLAALDWFTALRPFRIAVVWTGYEWLKSVGFLGYPWGLVGYPLAGWHLVAQIAELTGVWGLTFMVALINASLVELALDGAQRGVRALRPGTGRPWRPLAAGALTILVAAGFGMQRVNAIRPVATLPFLLVQQNVDSWAPGFFDEALETAQLLTARALAERRERGEGDPVAAIWSETALRRPYPDEFYLQRPSSLPFQLFLRRAGVPLVTGAPIRIGDSGDYSNGALVITPEGRVVGRYGKQQLVPFAEGIPFWEFAAVRTFFREVVGLVGTWAPGRATTVIDLPVNPGQLARGADAPSRGTAHSPAAPSTVTIGTPICFEDGFGWVPRRMVRRGADLLVNLTNNSWSRQESAQIQHYVAAQLRTIETRTTLIRGTNSGLSGVVDATGRLTTALPMFEQQAAVVDVPLYPRVRTVYLVIGDFFGWIAALGAILGAAVRSVVWYRAQRRPRAGLRGRRADPLLSP